MAPAGSAGRCAATGPPARSCRSCVAAASMTFALLDGVGHAVSRRRRACPPRERIDQDQAVPVVGRADDDGVDFLVVEELAVVAVQLRGVLPPALQRVLRAAASRTLLVHVGERHALDALRLQGRAHVGPAHALAADDAEAHAVTRRRSLGLGDGLSARDEAGADRRQRRALDGEVPSGIRSCRFTSHGRSETVACLSSAARFAPHEGPGPRLCEAPHVLDAYRRRRPGTPPRSSGSEPARSRLQAQREYRALDPPGRPLGTVRPIS